MDGLGSFLFLLILMAVGLTVLAGAVVLVLKLVRGAEAESEVSYSKIDLLTDAERHFFKSLVRVVGGGRYVLAKVRLADIIAPKVSRSESKEWRQAFNKVQSKHLDFVVCEEGSLKVLCAVELDDKSHKRADRAKRDQFVDKALAGAGIPMCRFAVQREYKEQDIARKISERLEGGEAKAVQPAFRLT